MKERVKRMRQAIPWRERSFRERFERWIETNVPNARWHVIKDTDLTYLLVGALNEERYYAKAVTDISRGEANLLAFLAERHPDFVPDVIAIDSARNWLLMRDIGGEALRERPDVSRYETALRQYAQLQRQEIDQIETYLSYGIPDRRPATLKDEIQTYLPELCVGLEQYKAEVMLALQDELIAMCWRLGCR